MSVSNVQISYVGADWTRHERLRHTAGNKNYQECEHYFVGNHLFFLGGGNHLEFRKAVIAKKRF